MFKSTLCDPMDCSPPGSSVHGISQARILQWIAISFRRSSLPRDQTCNSWIVRCILYQRQATSVLLPRKSHGWRSLVGHSPWGRHESVTTERLHFHFSLSRTGEANGTPLHCSCLENPRDRGAWWAAVSGVAQSQTRLKRLSSSSSSRCAFPSGFEGHSFPEKLGHK